MASCLGVQLVARSPFHVVASNLSCNSLPLRSCRDFPFTKIKIRITIQLLIHEVRMYISWKLVCTRCFDHFFQSKPIVHVMCTHLCMYTYMYLIYHAFAGYMADILECQEAIYRGRTPRLSLPETQLYPYVLMYVKIVLNLLPF